MTASGSKMRLAIIGIGRWGKNLVREFSKLAEIKYCLHSGNTENACWLQEHYPNITLASSYDDILKDSTIEGVIIATPTRTHFSLAMEALKAGKHIFVEKPLAESLEDARLLVAESKKRKRILFTGYIFAYHPVLQKLQSQLQWDPPVYAALEWNKYGTFDDDIIQSLMSHEISIVHLLFGSPRSIEIKRTNGTITPCDSISVECHSRNIRCNIRIDRTASFKHKSVLVVSRRNTWLWEGLSLWKFDRRTNQVSLVFQSSETPLELECGAFLKSISQSRKSTHNGVFGLYVSESLAQINPIKSRQQY